MFSVVMCVSLHCTQCIVCAGILCWIMQMSLTFLSLLDVLWRHAAPQKIDRYYFFVVALNSILCITLRSKTVAETTILCHYRADLRSHHHPLFLSSPFLSGPDCESCERLTAFIQLYYQAVTLWYHLNCYVVKRKWKKTRKYAAKVNRDGQKKNIQKRSETLPEGITYSNTYQFDHFMPEMRWIFY